MTKNKLKIAWMTFTCCEDSSIMFTEMLNDRFFDWKELIEFRHANILQSKNELSDIQVAFLEGAICTEKEKAKALKVRGIAEHVVAIGACACAGMPTAQRNNFDENTKEDIAPYLQKYHQLDKVMALEEVIKVDDKVPGCPMIEDMFLKVVEKYLKLYKIVPEDTVIK